MFSYSLVTRLESSYALCIIADSILCLPPCDKRPSSVRIFGFSDSGRELTNPRMKSIEPSKFIEPSLLILSKDASGKRSTSLVARSDALYCATSASLANLVNCTRSVSVKRVRTNTGRSIPEISQPFSAAYFSI
ncbi:hypothetical protein D3C71_1538210 [compost metagenome]